MLEKNIKFICERELAIQFSSLVINVESIEKLYPDGFKGFFLDDICMAFTNGFIVVIVEMQSYPSYLYKIIEDKLQPLGFQEGRDYVIGLDEPTTELNGKPIPDHQLPWCEKADWLSSIVSSKEGNKVWHTDFDKAQEAFTEAIRDEKPWTQYWTFWYDNHPTLKKYRLKKFYSGYPLFNLDENRYDVVDQNIFSRFEEDRIPFFIGSQFGVYPRLEEILNPSYIGYAAVLGKSLLSGVVAGLNIYVVEDLKLGEKLLTIKNQKSYQVYV